MMEFLKQMQQFAGQVSLYYRPLGEEAVTLNADLPLIAASVIKIPVMVEAFRRIEAGKLNPEAIYVLRAEDKKPSCGALTYMHDGLAVTVMDLITLMIILSDNTATNVLIDMLGMNAINQTMVALDIPGIHLRRKLFDAEKSAQGIQNTITARGIGQLLERMATGTLLSPEADARMVAILADQRLNGKLPFYLHGVRIAHKTGEDDGITHDVGVVYAKKPFVVCMLSNEVEVPMFERLIQEAGRELYELNSADN